MPKYYIDRKDNEGTTFHYHGWNYKLDIPRLYWNDCGITIYNSKKKAEQTARKIDTWISRSKQNNPNWNKYQCEIKEVK